MLAFPISTLVSVVESDVQEHFYTRTELMTHFHLSVHVKSDEKPPPPCTVCNKRTGLFRELSSDDALAQAQLYMYERRFGLAIELL